MKHRPWGTGLASAGLAACALAPWLVDKAFFYTLGVLVCIYALLALSVHLMLRIGQLSLAQAGFMGVGAYASALLSRDGGWSFVAAASAAAVLSVLLAWMVGWVILRVRGIQFVLLTFALGQAIPLVFTEWIHPFGGAGGLTGIPAASVGAWSFKGKGMFYGLALGLLVTGFSLSNSLFSGRVGMVLKGIAANEPLMQSLGVDVFAYRQLVFATGAMLGSVSGSLYAHFFGFISPDAFHVTTTVNALIMNVIGGTGMVSGAVLGALILVPLPELFRGTVVYLQLLYGLTLLLLMLFLPKGLASVPALLSRRRRKRRA